MNPEVEKADSDYRRRLFLAYGLSTLSLLVLVPLGAQTFLDYVVQADRHHQLLAAEATGIGFLWLFIGPSVYLMIAGRRAIAERRWPHTGMKVIHDTVIHRDARAIAKGRRLFWLGAFCIFAVAAGSAVTHFIFYKFRTDPFYFVRDFQVRDTI